MNASRIGTTFDANRCLQWCLSQDTRVSVNAWGSDAPGGAQTSQTLRQTLQSPLARNHLFITSAGNSNATLSTNASAFYPALLNLPNMLVVGATDANDARGVWADGGSNWNPDIVQIGAPGVNIVTDDWTGASTDPTREFQAQFMSQGIALVVAGMIPDVDIDLLYAVWYRNVSGSSVASAFVGGAASLLLSAVPQANSTDLKQWIVNGADHVNGLTSFFGQGVSLE